MRKWLTFVLAFTAYFVHAQNYYVLRGYVYDDENHAIPNVYVQIQNTGEGTLTNDKGQYEILLQEGLNRVVYSILGYQSQTIDLVIKSDVVKNIWLTPSAETMGEITVKHKKKRDYSYQIMQNVIDNKYRYQNQYQTCKHEVYVKSREEIKDYSNNDLGTTNYLSIKDSVPNLNLFEGHFIVNYQAPESYKEEKTAAEKHGSQRSLFYTSTTDGKFDFYENFFTIKKLGDNTFVSPLSPTTFVSYRFKLLESYQHEGKLVYRIKLTPKNLGNALLEGEIEVYDKIWAIKSLSLEFPKNLLISYDYFKVEQEYIFIDSIQVVSKQEFSWRIQTSDMKWYGHCLAQHSKYIFDTTYSKRFFGNALGITTQDAYEKDTSYWTQIRPVPLSKEEQSFIRYKDSISLLMNSEAYLDSIDSVFNQITWLKLGLNGFGYINRKAKYTYFFYPLISVIDPAAIGGWRVRYGASYYKKFEDKTDLNLSTMLNYGFRNQDLNGNFHIWYKFDPIKQSRVVFDFGRNFGFVNDFASISDILRRDNFYRNTYGSFNYRTELINGLYVRFGSSYTIREDLGNFKFSPAGDSLFENNDPIRFETNSNFMTSIFLEYTPKQLYLLEPREKIVLGSRYPTFQLYFYQAFRGVFGATNRFSYGSFAVDQTINLGTIGTSEYRVHIGKFFDTTAMSVMDYAYQRGGDNWWFSPPMYTFQLIPKTFPTIDWYFQGHYVHQFNGFLTGRLPGFKQAGIKTMGGGGILYAPEHNFEYSELFFGANRIFKIGRERMRLGLYYVVAQSNDFGLRSGFKFSFEFYNEDKNTWSF